MGEGEREGKREREGESVREMIGRKGKQHRLNIRGKRTKRQLVGAAHSTSNPFQTFHTYHTSGSLSSCMEIVHHHPYSKECRHQQGQGVPYNSSHINNI